jgi:hypothetical protein
MNRAFVVIVLLGSSFMASSGGAQNLTWFAYKTAAEICHP